MDGVKATHYQWTEKIAIVIKMQETNMYVAEASTGAAFATPVMEHDIIEPLGQVLGTEDTHWSSFKVRAREMLTNGTLYHPDRCAFTQMNSGSSSCTCISCAPVCEAFPPFLSTVAPDFALNGSP